MPFYSKLGKIPNKRHCQFRDENGNLYHEQLFGTIGFDGMSSLMYHINPPTVVQEYKGRTDVRPEIADDGDMIMKSYKGYKVAPEKRLFKK